MMDLHGKRIAVLVTSGVEEVELVRPVNYLRERGATVVIISPLPEEVNNVIRSMNGNASGNSLYADKLLKDVRADEFEALLIPGGFSPDHLRMAPGAVDFVKAFADKMIFAICHGPQLLISANLVKGRRITSWPALEIDMKNAGADWVNEPVVVDGNLLTSRMPADIPLFMEKIEQALSNPEQFRRKAA